jgi:hypothetical protein
VRAFVYFLFATCATAAVAAPLAVQVGDARIGMDAPPGFADTGFTGSPRLQELAESLTSASNRILLFAISDLDLRKFTVGDPPELRRYMIAVTPKSLERERVTPAMFGELAADALRGLGAAAPAEKDAKVYLDSQPAGRQSLLAEPRRDSGMLSFVQGTRLPPAGRFDEKPLYLLTSTTLILLRGKALNLSVYSAYESPADLDWIRSITVRWIGELQRLNNR